jgi:hypothetical protein
MIWPVKGDPSTSRAGQREHPAGSEYGTDEMYERRCEPSKPVVREGAVRNPELGSGWRAALVARPPKC